MTMLKGLRLFIVYCVLSIVHNATIETAHAQWGFGPMYVARVDGPQHGLGLSAERILGMAGTWGQLGVRSQISYSAGTGALGLDRLYHSGLADVSVTRSIEYDFLRPVVGLGIGIEVYGLRTGDARNPEVTRWEGYGVIQLGAELWPKALISPYVGVQGRRLLDAYVREYQFPKEGLLQGELLLGLHIGL